MEYLLQMALTLFRRRPKLVCDTGTWQKGVLELKRRTGGRKESGAFLLGRVISGVRHIEKFVFYDDIDPYCFKNGIVEFDGRKFGLVWSKCRELNLTIVADVHVHPGHFGQSASDRHNPMIAEKGHLALILPYFAARDCLPGRIGVYEYLGMRKWRDHSAKGATVFQLKRR